jgi:hypothetical protein
VLVEDHAELAAGFEIANRKVVCWLAARVACFGAFPCHPLEVVVRVGGFPSRGSPSSGECCVDGTESSLPIVGVPVVGRQLFVAVQKKYYLIACAQILDDVEDESVPEVPCITRPGEFPRCPRRTLLIRASHGLLEQTRYVVSIVSAFGLVFSEFVSEVVGFVGVVFARAVGFSLIAGECGLCIVAHSHGEREGCTCD